MRLADKVVIQRLKFTFDLDLIIFVAQEVLHPRVISHFVLSTRVYTRQHIQLLSVVNVGLTQVHLLRLHFLARLWSGFGEHTATATPDANRQFLQETLKVFGKHLLVNFDIQVSRHHIQRLTAVEPNFDPQIQRIDHIEQQVILLHVLVERAIPWQQLRH